MKGKGGGGVFEGEESLGDDGKSAIGFGGKLGGGGWGSGGGRREAVAAGFGLRLGRSGWVGVGSGRSVSVVSGGCSARDQEVYVSFVWAAC